MFLKKFAFILTLALCAFSFADEYVEYPPKVDGCYQISTGQEMNGFIGIVNGTYVKEYSPDGEFWDENGDRFDYVDIKDSTACGVLTADISLIADEFGWVPLKNFSGSFDGQGHTIANLGVGGGTYFFESIVGGTEDNPVTIKNVGWVNGSLSYDRNYIGLIYSVNGNVHLDHLFNDVDFSVKEGNVAAFVLGQRGHLTISNSYNTGKIMNGYYDKETSGIFVGNAGGVVHLENVYNRGGNVSLIGYAHDTVTIVNGYTVGEGKSDPVVDRTEYQGSYAVVRQSNFYYPNTVVSYGVPVEDFVDGSIALKLHYMNDDGEIWGQNADVDSFPDFSGKITGDHSSTVKVSNITVVSFEGDTTAYPKYYIEGLDRPFEYLPSPRDGFVFSGWFDNPNGAGEPITEISRFVTGDKTLYGKWWAAAERTGDCYEIGSMEDLFGFAAVVNGAPGVEKDSLACGKLVADVKYQTQSERYDDGLWWLPIQNFAGSFDGNGHTISGLYSKNASEYEDESEPVGLFGSISGGSAEKPVVIKNLKLQGCNFNAEWGGGAVVGRVNKNSNAVLDSIEVDMPLRGTYRIGGIVGIVGGFAELTLSNSIKKGEVDGSYNMGGLVGDVWGNARVTIFNSFIDGEVSAKNSGVGSIIGYVNNDAEILIRQTYAKGDVYGFSYMGGLVGNNNGFLRIENTYHVGDVTTRSSCPDGAGSFGGAVIGGFVGVSYGVLSLVNSYQLGTVYNKCTDRISGKVNGKTGLIAGFMHPEDVRTDNVFYPSTLIADSTVDGVDGEMFTNGFVANALHHYDNGEINGAIWGQEVGVDQYPVFTSEIKGYEGEHNFSKLVLYTYEGDPLKYATTYEEGVETPLPVPYREGHIFHGWFEDADFSGDSIGMISATATGELHYYANLEIKRFYWDAAIIVDLDSCGGSVEGVGYYDYGSTVTLTAVPDPGCKLDDRYTTFKDGIEVRENITSDGAVRAYFTCEKYDIIYHLDKGSFPYWYDKQYSHGRATELVTPNHPRCYTFAGWYDNEGLEGEPIDSIPKGSIGVKEFWSKWTLDDTESCQEISSSSVASSSSEQQSSSSVSSSSSSVLSSSSETSVSSSSKGDGGSEAAMTSSSSAPESSSGAKSSSSSAKSSSSDAPKSSSSKTNFIAPVWDVNMVVSTAGRNIHIDGARIGMPLALFDMQGRVIHAGRTGAPSVDLQVPNPGSYLVKIGSSMKLVRIK